MINLLELETNKVSRNINDYSLMLTAPTGFGKTPFLAELYGDRGLILSFDNSHKGIEGVNAVNIDSYNILVSYVNQLMNPQVREKFDAIIIDTLSLLDFSCENQVTDSYGKDLLGDCLQWNKAYKIVDKKFLTIIKQLQSMNYTMVYSCHPSEKKVKLNDGKEILRYDPKVSDRIKNLLVPEIDIRLFGAFDSEGKKVLYTHATPFFDARCRAGEMDKVIPFNAQALREAFVVGVERKVSKGNIVDNLEFKNVVKEQTRPFKDIKNDIMKYGTLLKEQGLGVKANEIVCQELGLDNEGNQRTLQNVNEKMSPALEVICTKLKLQLEQI